MDKPSDWVVFTQRLGYCPEGWVKHLTQLLVENKPAWCVLSNILFLTQHFLECNLALQRWDCACHNAAFYSLSEDGLELYHIPNILWWKGVHIPSLYSELDHYLSWNNSTWAKEASRNLYPYKTLEGFWDMGMSLFSPFFHCVRELTVCSLGHRRVKCSRLHLYITIVLLPESKVSVTLWSAHV